jgi:hypothetical protein
VLDFNNAPRQKIHDEPAPRRQMHSTMPSLQTAARILGGEVSGGGILCPGPGHSSKDRSLSVLLDPNAPEGFIVNSFAAGDDVLACRNYVREKLGLPRRQPRSSQKRNSTGSSGFARQKVPPEEPAKATSDSPFPEWTPPNEEGKPRFVGIGSEEPPAIPGEIPGRRHIYRRGGQNVRAKIKKQGRYQPLDVKLSRRCDGAGEFGSAEYGQRRIRRGRLGGATLSHNSADARETSMFCTSLILCRFEKNSRIQARFSPDGGLRGAGAKCRITDQ